MSAASLDYARHHFRIAVRTAYSDAESDPNEPSRARASTFRIIVAVDGPARSSPIDAAGSKAKELPQTVSLAKSRWKTFRQLCQYYAECVRLDQGTTIHGKANAENETFVCLGGSLNWPESDIPPEMRIDIPSGWSEFVKRAKTASHLYLGAPLNRYVWKDSQAKRDIVFVSPVFLAPVSFEIAQTSLRFRLLGPVRINDGWLERRLKNSEDRRVFLELCGFDVDESDHLGGEPHYRSFSPFCQLLRHYYASWCKEQLDVRQLQTSPGIAHVQADGIYNRAALFLPGKWRFTARLYDELHKLAWQVPDEDLDRSALTHVFPHVKPRRWQRSETGQQATDRNHDARESTASDCHDRLVSQASVEPLNPEQRMACEAANSEPLTVIVGPPGTGKSRVVANVLSQAAIADRSALFASKNHQALEAVVPRLNAVVEPSQIILRLARPFGQGTDAGLQLAIGELISKPSDATAAERRDRLKTHLSELLSQFEEICHELSEQQELYAALDDAEGFAQWNVDSLPERARNRVAEASGLPGSAELNRLIQQFAPLTPLQASWQWIRRLLARVFQGRKTVAEACEVCEAYQTQFGESELDGRPASGQRTSSNLRRELDSWLNYARAVEATGRAVELRAQLAACPGLDSLYERFGATLNNVVGLSRKCLQAVANSWGSELDASERQQLVNLWAGIQNYGADDGGLAAQKIGRLLERTFPILLRHVPLLATTNLSVGRHLPWQAGAIDVLVVDEASQCDIASVIPLLFRCRRAAFVGDPMQLSHVTRISGALDTQLRRQFNLLDTELERFSYRTTSAYHLAASADCFVKPVQLRQHHRCHPQIAKYCNSTFYRDSLLVMTGSESPTKQPGGLKWTHVPADVESVPGGGAVSGAQIRAIHAELHRLLEDGFEGTVGIVTPFRQQANRLRDLIWQGLETPILREWRLLVDTADGFQGDERDLVLFSLVGGADMPAGSARFLSQTPNRFNVAVSRAKRLLHVFGDIQWAQSCAVNHIRRLATACATPERPVEPRRDDLIGPVWEPRLATAMHQRGIPFEQQYPACGRFLDFAVMRPDLKLDVEVDGEAYHRNWDGSRKRDDLERDLVLIANGWKVMRFWVYQLRDNMDGCLDRIQRQLQSG